MKRKFSLLINIAVICLCICALAIGVYSATTAQLTVSGTIGFTAHECELDVQISKQGYAYEDDLTQYYDSPQYIDFDSTEATNTIGRLGGKEATIKGPVNLGSMNFTDLAEDTIPPIVVKISVTNQSAYPVSGFVMVNVPENSNIIYTRQYTQLYNNNPDHANSIKEAEHESAVILSAKETEQATATFIVTFKVGAPDQSIDPAKAITITGDFAKYDKTLLQNELKTYDDTTNKLRYTVNSSDYASYSVTTISKDVEDVEILSTINHLPVTQISYTAFSSDTTITSVKIPDTVTIIGNSAFNGCTKLKTAYLSSTLKTIGNKAFYKCRALKEIYIPSSVIKSGDNAFYYCNLTKLNISSLESWCKIDFGVYGNPLSYADNLYINNYLITHLNIPESITIIKKYAFYECSAITEITIPNSVTKIEQAAFHSSTNLLKINMSKRLESIETQAFYNCKDLKEIFIPSTLKTIGSHAFYGCDALAKVNTESIESWCNIDFQPADYESQGSNPITESGNLYINDILLTKLTIPNTIKEIKPYAFFNCKSLTEIFISNNVTKIGDSAFSLCTGCTNLILSDNLTTIGVGAFSSCENLSGELNIPDSVTSIGQSAFSGCVNLTHVTLPAEIKSIPSFMFSDCEALNTLILPSTVTSIGDYAFSDSNISTLICKATTIPSATYAFIKHSSNTSPAYIKAIYVLPELVEKYKTTAGWSTYADVIYPIEN